MGMWAKRLPVDLFFHKDEEEINKQQEEEEKRKDEAQYDNEDDFGQGDFTQQDFQGQQQGYDQGEDWGATPGGFEQGQMAPQGPQVPTGYDENQTWADQGQFDQQQQGGDQQQFNQNSWDQQPRVQQDGQENFGGYQQQTTNAELD